MCSKSFINASWIIPFVLGVIISQILVVVTTDRDHQTLIKCVENENKATVVLEDDDYYDDKNEEEGDDDGYDYNDDELEKNSKLNNNNNKNDNNNKRRDFVYVPASTEDYIMNHFEDLGYNIEDWKVAEACPIWFKPEVSTQENFDNLQAYRKDINEYSKRVNEFYINNNNNNNNTVPNFVKTMRKEGHSIDQKELCKAARLHPNGMEGLFLSQSAVIVNSSGLR